ncbi:hypothetical protein Tco_0124597, partial [Tanacetum coccineum]
AIRLQAEFDEDGRLAREKDKANVTLTKEWNDIQAKIDVDYQLAQRLQAQEKEELTVAEKGYFICLTLGEKKKTLCSKKSRREKEQTTNKSSTKKQNVYLSEEYGRIAQESSSKRAGEALEQESSNKQKLEEDKESKELKKYLEMVPDDGDDVTIDATPLYTKSPTTVDYKIYQEGKKAFSKLLEQM